MKSYSEFNDTLNENKDERWIKKIETKTNTKATKGQSNKVNEFVFSDGSYAVVSNGDINYYSGGSGNRYSNSDWVSGYRSVAQFLSYLNASGKLKND